MQCVAQGDVVGGQFRLIAELAQGGMGTVWRAHHLKLRSHVAIKVIDPVIALDPQALRRFLGEARMAAALRSPHIVQILDYGVDGDRPYIAMEMLEGESLAAVLTRCGRLNALETARVIRHVARALGRAHDAGIVHRDLKPENIFVVSNDDEVLIKVLDFGIAKARLQDAAPSVSSLATRTGAVMGTPHFMSPEQAEALPSVDFRADLWALGVVAFECLLGELPFKGNSMTQVVLAICRDPLPIPSQLGPVPGGFDAWFARACARNPDHRFESAKQAADAFEQLEPSIPGVPESRRSSPPMSIASDAGSRDAGARRVGMGALRSWALRSRVPLSALAGVLLLGGGIRFVTGQFDGAEASVVPVSSTGTASTELVSTGSVSTGSDRLPAAQAFLHLSPPMAAVASGDPVLETNGPQPALSMPAEPSRQLIPAEQASRASVTKNTAARRTGGGRPGAKTEMTASPRPSKSSTQRSIVQKPTSRRTVDLGF